MENSNMMLHEQLGIEYPNIPYLWHYNDFANLYTTFKIIKLDKKLIIKLLEKINNKQLLKEINNLSDDITDYYINIQYKADSIFYNNKSDEIYIGFHTWLHKVHTGLNKIEKTKMYTQYKFECGIFTVLGKVAYPKDYPFKKT